MSTSKRKVSKKEDKKKVYLTEQDEEDEKKRKNSKDRPKKKKLNLAKIQKALSKTKKNKNNFDDCMSDIEGSRVNEESEESEDEDLEEKKNKTKDKSESNKDSSEASVCNICYHQKILASNKTHAKMHDKSEMIKKLMQKSFERSSEQNMVICRVCKKKNEESSTFNHAHPLKHLMQNHIKKFKENEKEFLKQIDFFCLIKQKDPKYEEVVNRFPFSYNELKKLVKAYFSTDKEEKKRKNVILGELYEELIPILKSEQVKYKVSKKIQEYLNEFQNQNDRKQAESQESPNEEEKNESEINTQTATTGGDFNKSNKRAGRELSNEPLEKKVKLNENHGQKLLSSKSLEEQLELYKSKYAESKMQEDLLKEKLDKVTNKVQELEEERNRLQDEVKKLKKKK